MGTAFNFTLLVWLISSGFANGFEVVVDTSQAPSLEDFGIRVKKALEDFYPEVRDLLKSDSSREVDQITIFFDPYHVGRPFPVLGLNIIVGSAELYNLIQESSSFNSFVYQMTRIIQCYRSCDAWITEGIAEWITSFHYDPWNKPIRPKRGDHYINEVRTGAYFLNWLNTNYQPSGKNMTYWLNKYCQEGAQPYPFDIFVNLTGKTTEALWEEMKNSPLDDISVLVDTRKAPDLAEFGEQVKAHLEEWYPIIREAVYTPTFEETDRILVTFIPDYGDSALGPGWSVSYFMEIYANMQHFRNNPGDLDSMVELMSSTILQYGDAPKWIHTGMKAWIQRFIYKPETSLVKPAPGASYIDGGDSAAYFFNWLNSKYELTYWLNERCRQDSCSDDVFLILTGKTVQENWDEMMQL